MKINRLGLAAALALGGLLACTNLTFAQDANAPKKGRGMSVEQQVDRLTKELNLTDDQKTKVTALLEDQGKQMRALRDISDPQERRDKRQEIAKDTDKKMKEILKPDQFEKYQKMREEMRQRKGAPGGGTAPPADK